MILTLPYPPSVNHYWRKWRNRMVISPEGRAYRRQVAALLDGHGPRKPPAGGRIALGMDAFPPDRRARDLDNIQKGICDALEHAGIYENDRQIDWLTSRRREVVQGGRLEVHVKTLPVDWDVRRRCPVCGACAPDWLATD